MCYKIDLLKNLRVTHLLGNIVIQEVRFHDYRFVVFCRAFTGTVKIISNIPVILTTNMPANRT